MFKQLFSLVGDSVHVKHVCIFLYYFWPVVLLDNLGQDVFFLYFHFFSQEQLISASTTQIFQLQSQIARELKRRPQGFKGAPKSNERSKFQPPLPFHSVFLSGSITIQPDRFKEEREKQLRWIHSYC